MATQRGLGTSRSEAVRSTGRATDRRTFGGIPISAKDKTDQCPKPCSFFHLPRAGRYPHPTTPNPALCSMLRSISSTHAIMLLLWAHILRVAIARRVVVDDSETDKIRYSKGWAEYPGCLGCTQALDLPREYVNNGTWHGHVAYNSDNQLALINLSQLGREFNRNRP